MKKAGILLLLCLVLSYIACDEKTQIDIGDTTDQITIDSLVASLYTVKAWDSISISCYATGIDLEYAWECDHGNFNGGGTQIRYAAGECCVGLNTIKCSVSNDSGMVSKEIQVLVTSYFDKKK